MQHNSQILLESYLILEEQTSTHIYKVNVVNKTALANICETSRVFLSNCCMCVIKKKKNITAYCYAIAFSLFPK